MIITVTGHRPKYLGNEYNLSGPYSNYIRKKLQEVIDKHKPTQMISGMALGVDTMWAQLAVANEIQLIAAVPFRGQAAHWPRIHEVRYAKLLDQAHECHIITEDNSDMVAAFHKRDRWMVDRADMVVAVLDPKNKSSGTAYTAKYAEDQDIPVIYIDPNGWRP